MIFSVVSLVDDSNLPSHSTNKDSGHAPPSVGSRKSNQSIPTASRPGEFFGVEVNAAASSAES